jgi:hypothetical protein
LISFTRAISNGDEASHYSHRGLTYFKLGKTDESLIDFNIAIDKAKDNPDSNFTMHDKMINSK